MAIPARARAGQRLIGATRAVVNRAGFDVTRDVFRHRFLHALAEHRVHTVLDIGANTGQFGLALRRGGFAGRIHSVEPLRAAYAELAVVGAADPGWTSQRSAVSNRSGTVTMNVSANSVSSSLLPILARSTEAAPQTGYVGTEDVEATTVDAMVSALGLDPARTMLKIDVQGFEKAVLDGAGATLSTVAGVRSELSLVPLYEGQALLPELVASMQAQGLDLWIIEPGWAEPGTHRMLQVDGTFFRSD